MAINFPNSPSVNDIHSEGGIRWKWNGSSWTRSGGAAVTDTLTTANDNSTTTLYPVMVTGTGGQTAKIATTATKNISFDASDGNLTIGGDVSIGGTVTYEDVKNVDSVGIVTARTGIHIDDSITHIGDTDTKIRFPAADTIQFETGGTQRVTVNNTTGVNTLDVLGGARADYFVGRSNQSAPTADAAMYRAADNTLAFSTANTERLRIASDGKIGIGNNNPAYNLDIKNGTSARVAIDVTTGSDAAIWMDGMNADFAGSDYWGLKAQSSGEFAIFKASSEKLRISSTGLIWAKTRSAEVRRMILSGSPSNASFNIEAHDGESGTSSGDVQGKLGLFYNDGSTLTNTACISFERGSGAPDGAMAFVTNQAERLRITSGGNLTLGTTVSNERVHIHTASSLKAQQQFTNTTTGTGAGDGLVIGITGGEDSIFWNQENTHMLFATNNTERLRITSGGNTGIGTASITHKLHTFGAGNAGGARFENSHTTTTVSGNTASGAFPHNILLSNYQGSGAADNRMVSIGFDIPTTGSHANATIAYQATNSSGNGDLQFWLEENNTSKERLRITSTGQLLLGATAASNAESFRIHTSDSGKAIIKLTNSTTGTATGDGFEFGMNGNEQIEFVNKENTDMFFATNNTERLRIDSNGKVGINEASPDRALHVKSTTDVEQIYVENTASSGRAQIRYVNPHGDWVTGTIGGTTEGDFITYTAAAKNFRIYTNNLEKFRIDSTGDVKFWGTNTSNNTNKSVNLTAPSYNTSEEDVNLVQVENESGFNQISFGGGTSGLNSATILRFITASAVNTTAGTERLRIDSSGNIGQAVTPSAWSSAQANDFFAYQVGSGTALFGRGSGDEDRGGISANLYCTASAWKYIANGNAGRIYFEDGSIVFNTCDSGSAGATATLNERLKIDVNGRLLIGTQRTYSGASYYDDITINNSNGSNATGGTGITLISSTNSWASILLGDSDDHDVGAIKYDHNTNSLRFVVNTIDPAVLIDSSGRVLIGTTTEGHADADDLTISATNPGITLRSATNGSGSIFFSDATSGVGEYDCFAQFYHSTQYFRFGINNDEKLRITSSGQVILGDSDAISAGSLLHLYQASNDPYINIQRGSGDAAVAIGGISWKNSSITTAGIYGFTDNINDGTLRFHTAEGGTNTEKLHITKGGAVVVQREHLQISRGGSNATNFTKGGLVFATPAYNEYHYTWSGQSSYTIDLTCGSYFHCEFIYTQAQTNGGVEMHYYVRGKWANNHTTHTGIIWELHGDGGGLAVSFTASDQSGNGSVDMKNNMSDTSNSQAGNGYVNGGGEGQNTGSANGRLRIAETYSWGSVSTRCLIVKVYYGSFSISKS